MLKPRYEVFNYFLKLGTLGFGGPLAIVSNMQKECVEEKKWINHEDFNSAFALIKAMPGPIAFMTAVYLGRIRAGFWGGLLAGVAINLPAFILMILFSLFFNSLSHFRFINIFMLGMQVSALGVILGSLKGIIRGHGKNFYFWFLVIISGIINYFYPFLEPVIILSFGIMHMSFKKFFEMGSLILVFFKAGALVFGSGLAIVPMLQHDVVTKYHWLSQSEFLNALAFGQMTPGPVVITATYIGHKMYGMQGALLATISIFSASFFHMSTWFPHVIKKLQGKKWIGNFIFGAVAAVVGPIIVAVFKLGVGIHLTPPLLILMGASFIITLKDLLPIWSIIPLGGIAIWIQSFF